VYRTTTTPASTSAGGSSPDRNRTNPHNDDDAARVPDSRRRHAWNVLTATPLARQNATTDIPESACAAINDAH